MYAAPTFVGISLWLVPRPEQQEKLQKIVAKHATKHAAPCFPPHCTLIPGLTLDEEEVLQSTNQLACQLETFTTTVKGVGIKELFFQSVFALLEKDAALMKVRDLARKQFNMEGEDDFMPHISLLYGCDMSVREQVKQEIDEEDRLTGTTIDMESIEVWKTGGEAKEWILLGRYPLRSSDSA